MRKYGGYLIDLDGTMYRGNQVIKEAPAFVRWLREQQIAFLFLTNNSSMTPDQVAQKLTGMGIDARADEVFTSAMAAAAFLAKEWKEEKPVKVYAIGEQGVHQALAQVNAVIDEENPDFVVVGIDRDFTYEKMAKASLAIQKGAFFLSTNGDRAIPAERGLLPGNGSLTHAIEVASGQKACFVGKPEPIIIELALERLGIPPGDAVLVGDNMQTDILSGVRGGIDTVLVYTGITRPADVNKSDFAPAYHVNHLKEWMDKYD